MISPGSLQSHRTITVEQRTFRTLADSVMFYGIIALLMFGPLAFGAVQPWSIFVLETGAGSLLLVWVLQQFASNEVCILGSPLFAPALVFAGLIALQLITGLSSYRQATLSQLLLYGCYGSLCFLIVQTLRRTWQVKQLAIGFSVYGSAVALFALLQNLTSPEKLYWLRTPHFGSWIYGPYPNHNHYAGLMEMLFPIPLVFSLTRHAFGIARVLSVTAAAIMATSIFLSGSRGGMFSFLVQIVFFVLVSIRRKKSFRSMIPLSAFAVIVLGMLIWLGGEQLSHRFATFYTHADSELSSNDRLHIDRDAIKLFSHKPILGFGLGTFSDVYPQFRSFYTNFVVNAAHNDYLQLLVETGILGFGAMLWFLIIVYKRAIVKLEGWTDDTNGAVGLAALLGISGILVHSFVDFNLRIPANAAIFFVLCAIAAMEPRFGLHRHRSQLQTDIFSV